MKIVASWEQNVFYLPLELLSVDHLVYFYSFSHVQVSIKIKYYVGTYVLICDIYTFWLSCWNQWQTFTNCGYAKYCKDGTTVVVNELTRCMLFCKEKQDQRNLWSQAQCKDHTFSKNPNLRSYLGSQITDLTMKRLMAHCSIEYHNITL